MADVRISGLVAVSAGNIAAGDLAPITNIVASPSTTYKYTLAQLRTAMFAATATNGAWGSTDYLVVGGASPPSSGWVRIDGGTQTANSPIVSAVQTWNNAGVTFQGILVNVTNTASGASSTLIDLQVGGSSMFAVSKAGAGTFAAGVTAGGNVHVTSGGITVDAGTTAVQALTATTFTATGLITASAGLTVANGQTLTLTGVSITGAPTWGSTQSLNTSGSAATLTNTRTIFGQNFNGSGNVSGALSGATTIDASGQITSTLSSAGSIFRALSGGTNNVYFDLGNAVGALQFGVNNHAGTGMGIGMGADAGVIMTYTTALDFGTSYTRRGGFTSAGAFDVTGTVKFPGVSAEGSTQSSACFITATGELTINSGVSTCLVSSKRFKHDIAPLSFADADHITRHLEPVRFLRNDNNEPALGLIAEQADEVNPLLAARNEEGQIVSIHQERVVAALLRSVQGYIAQLEALGVRVETIYDKVYA